MKSSEFDAMCALRVGRRTYTVKHRPTLKRVPVRRTRRFPLGEIIGLCIAGAVVYFVCTISPWLLFIV